uniref:Tudor domain-containing protein 7 n=1 Tax=Cacopsylla melanoneura TaxID=428564 RepID=A0A8D9AAY4_9HEMI
MSRVPSCKMDETDKKLIVSALRATIVSQKDGVELRRLNSDYRELEGEDIPYKALGFPSVEAYIRSLTNDFTIVPKQGALFVVAKKNDTLAHIQDLIRGQSTKKKVKAHVQVISRQIWLLQLQQSGIQETQSHLTQSLGWW